MADINLILVELEKLAAQLRNLRETYPKEPTLQDRRTAAGLSLKAVIDFIVEALPNGEQLSFALTDLMCALTEVEDGRSVAWFYNAPAHRAKGAPVAVATYKGRYAAFVELLVRQGKPVRDACREVLRDIPLKNRAFVFGASAQTWQTLKYWRDDCIGRAEASAEKAGFDFQLA